MNINYAKSGSDNMYVIRFSDNYGGVKDLSINGTGKTGVCGLGLFPKVLRNNKTRRPEL